MHVNCNSEQILNTQLLYNVLYLRNKTLQKLTRKSLHIFKWVMNKYKNKQENCKVQSVSEFQSSKMRKNVYFLCKNEAKQVNWIGKNLCAFYTVFEVIFETFHNPSFSILLPLRPPHHKKSKQTKKI